MTTPGSPIVPNNNSERCSADNLQSEICNFQSPQPSASSNNSEPWSSDNLQSKICSLQLKGLTVQQHHQLQIWMVQHSFDHVLSLIARPAPEGFGIKTQSEALHRYYREDLPKHALEIRRAQIHMIKNLAAVYSAEPAPYRTLTL